MSIDFILITYVLSTLPTPMANKCEDMSTSIIYVYLQYSVELESSRYLELIQN